MVPDCTRHRKSEPWQSQDCGSHPFHTPGLKIGMQNHYLIMVITDTPQAPPPESRGVVEP